MRLRLVTPSGLLALIRASYGLPITYVLAKRPKVALLAKSSGPPDGLGGR